jgi:hypothetical protein
MIEKAIVLADMALEFIRAAYPADDPKFAPMMKSIDETRKYITDLEKALAEEEHKQKSAVFKDKCPCPKCNENEASDRQSFKECLREVARGEITATTPDKEPELVFDAENKLDLTDTVFKN